MKTGEMTQFFSEDGQRVGFPVSDWSRRQLPPRTRIDGHYCAVEPIEPERHGDDLYASLCVGSDRRNWTYLPYGPFHERKRFDDWLVRTCLGEDPMFHAIVDKASGTAVGVASYLRINLDAGVIEVGHINFAQALQGTRAGTESMFLLMSRVFDELGFRRYEWKCDALNEKSCRAAERLGFSSEGVFRQATIYKDRNRDTAWFSVIDSEWPQLKAAFRSWLEPSNFDSCGNQLSSLRKVRASLGELAN